MWCDDSCDWTRVESRKVKATSKLMSRKFKWLILHVSYIWVIIMSMRLLEKARRRESCSSKLLWAFFLWIYSIGFTLRLIEANLIVTGSRDGHMIVTGCHGDRDTCGHFLALHDLNVVCSTGSFYPFFIISCNNIDIGVWPGCELKGGRWDSKKNFNNMLWFPWRSERSSAGDRTLQTSKKPTIRNV